MKEETEEQKQERIKLLMEGIELSKSGYAGVLPNGNIVDRRKHPEAMPVGKNSMFGIPDPKPVKQI